MTVTSPITAQSALPEHPENGVERGFVDAQPIVLAAKQIEKAAEKWDESKLLNVSILRALLRLACRHPEKASSGFNAMEIAEEVGAVIGRQWPENQLPGEANWEDTAGKVRQHWQTLTSKTWTKKKEGIRQHLQDVGINFMPELSRHEGGGTGNPTRYCFTMQPLDAQDRRLDQQGTFERVDDETSDRSASTPTDHQKISYVCEDVEDASRFIRIFAQDFGLSGWRRYALSSVLIVGILIVSFSFLFVVLTMVVKRPVTESMDALIAATIIGYAFWATLGTLLMLHRWRIALAPWWMQSAYDDRLIEWRCPPRYPGKSIKAVRYTARCPLCGGKITACAGGFIQPWKLVGRCEETPTAHVFSFDHVRREGFRLM